MPRPTREVTELRDALGMCRAHLRTQQGISEGLRKDLDGADRSIKNLHDTLARVERESLDHKKAARDAQSGYHTLLRRHQKVCMMWAEMVAQFDEVGVVAKDKEMSA